MIRVEQYDGEYIHNPNPRGETPFEEFWKVRGAIVSANAPFGKTGPEPDDPDADPEYWLIDDQYNDELYQYLGVVYPEGWSAPWMSALIAVLQHSPGWAIALDINKRETIVLFADRIMVSGPAFKDCRDLESVAATAKETARGDQELIYGSLMRQLEYLRTLLPTAIEKLGPSGYVHLATFDCYEGHQGTAVWILSRSDDLHTDGVVAYGARAVTDAATIYEPYCRKFHPFTKVSPPYWLLAFCVAGAAQEKLVIAKADKSPVGEIVIDEILTDEQLKKRFKVESSDWRKYRREHS